MTGETPDADGENRLPNRIFLQVEHAIYIALGVALSATAALALASVAPLFIQAVRDWTGADALLLIIDRLLTVLMVIEILHTVRASIRTGALTPEPFLIVGLIASIRRVLVITLKSSQSSESRSWTADLEAVFRSSMIELGVLAGLILIMVISIYLLRRERED